MNRINTFVILTISVFLSLFVVYLYVRDQVTREPDEIAAPMTVEAYRVDRYPLPGADIYLNQRFIGRTDGKGFFMTDINLIVGASYTLRIEKERDGYNYGPWETNFKVEAERKKRREKKQEEEAVQFPSLEGDLDVFTEIQRAELGRVSPFETYHFLAILDGSMYYTVHVTGKQDTPMADASVTVNGKLEGRTDENGVFVVGYEGEDVRGENIQVYKEGEHIWQKTIEISPSFNLHVNLNKMLLIDLYAYTESYDVMQGIGGAEVYVNQQLVGRTGQSGYFGYRYEDEQGVDGYLELHILYPPGYSPEEQLLSFFISRDLPRLTHTDFAYPTEVLAPRISVMPPRIADSSNVLLSRRAYDLKRGIEDYLSLGNIFSVVSDTYTAELFKQFKLEISKGGTRWSEIPFLKNTVEGIIFGELEQVGRAFSVRLYGINYEGDVICQLEGRFSLRDLDSLPEIFVEQFKGNFPYEGTISSVQEGIAINLGRRQGIEKDDKFYSFLKYYDDIKRDYSKKRVARFHITEVEERYALGELESISEGYLLEPGSVVKRFSEPVQALRQIPISIIVTSGRSGVQGANIYLDDQWTGQTDEEGRIEIVMTESSSADLLVYKEGYIPEKIGVRVKEGENNIRMQLRQGKTQFTIDSEPRGALLFIDGTFKGNTPFVREPIELPYGFHRIELRLDGYKDYNQYVKFSERRVSFTGSDRIILFEDYYRQAEEAYEDGRYEQALKILQSVPEAHPDFMRSLEFCGYIYLSHFNDYETAIACYSKVLDLQSPVGGPRDSASRDTASQGTASQDSASRDIVPRDIVPRVGVSRVSVISYYNYGQACYNLAEELYYDNSMESQFRFRQAIDAFKVVKAQKGRVQSSGRKSIYQDVLFYLAVSYQKLYYLSSLGEYLEQAYYAWVDYFDYFNNNLLEDSYFANQYRIAESYREEVKRLRSEKE
jgi:tetratricopeptide (TPR) repeat protein